MYRICLSIALIATLSACSTSSEKLIKASPRGSAVTFTKSVDKTNFAGYSASNIRTFGKGGAGVTIHSERRYVTADCELTGDSFKASFQTPETVNLPSFGIDSKPITIRCSADGKTIEETFQPINLSQQARNGNAAIAAGITAGLTGIVPTTSTAGQARPDDAYGYGPIDMNF